MESSVRDKCIVLGFVGFATVLMSPIATPVITDSSDQDSFVRWIVFVCCNLLGRLLYLSLQTLIFDTYEVYKVKFDKKETTTEAIEVQEELSRDTLEEVTSAPGPASVPESVPESSPTKEKTLIQTRPIELTIALDLRGKSRASYTSGEQREKEGHIRMVMEYCHYYLPHTIDQETMNYVCAGMDKWINLNTYTPRPTQRPFTKDIDDIPLRHFVWNISERFLYERYYNKDNRAEFIKTLFPKSFTDTDLLTIRNFKVEPLKTEVLIDKPENGKLNFHYPEDYMWNQDNHDTSDNRPVTHNRLFYTVPRVILPVICGWA